ncbi:MAG: hypothetical protein V4569_08140 [Pseudomonadota bacterium]
MVDSLLRRASAGALPLALALALGSATGGAWAQGADKSAERAARRMQLQMQNLQQQVQDAQAAKSKIETDKATLDKQVLDQAQQLARLKGALPRANQQLTAAEAERARLAAMVAALEKQLAEQKRDADEALALKGRELVQFTKARDEQQTQLQRRLDDQLGQVAECSVKNDRLIKLSAELLDRYRTKTASDALRQREPVLGFGDVQMFNLVQDYRDKTDAERFSPSINR